MFLIIDNYDSFVYNLARYFALAGVDCDVVRNDKITLSEIEALKPEALILSPGPCTPKEAGICIDTIKQFGAHTPILGVCLGHQAIGEAYGGRTIQTDTPIHGKSSLIHHTETALFEGIPNPTEVGRYHSLITQLPEDSQLDITAAQNDENIIMAMQHKTHPVYGVQFHPESILTEHGHQFIENFVRIAQEYNKRHHTLYACDPEMPNRLHGQAVQ